MLDQIVNVLVLVLQLLAAVWACGLFLRLVFGFGLDSKGNISCRNRRGLALQNLGRWVMSLFSGEQEDSKAKKQLK